jgi:hypothetical protein
MPGRRALPASAAHWSASLLPASTHHLDCEHRCTDVVSSTSCKLPQTMARTVRALTEPGRARLRRHHLLRVARNCAAQEITSAIIHRCECMGGSARSGGGSSLSSETRTVAGQKQARTSCGELQRSRRRYHETHGHTYTRIVHGAIRCVNSDSSWSADQSRARRHGLLTWGSDARYTLQAT